MTPDALFTALSDPTRLRSLVLLAQAGELCVCDLVAVLDMVQPKISRHLATLREAGLVRDRRRGVWVHYRLSDDLPDWVREVLAATVAGICDHAPFRGDLDRLSLRPRREEATP